MVYYNTIDIDNGDKHNLGDIVKKISSQKCCISLSWKDSSSKGYHISLTCTVKCDKCRMVFDDAKRFEMDNNREEKFRNTLFTDKEFVRGNLTTVGCTCDNCIKYARVINLTKRELTYEELVKIADKGKVPKIWNRKLMFIGYDYFECPICNWGKFVNRKNAQVKDDAKTN
jgi:hypothetical protein